MIASKELRIGNWVRGKNVRYRIGTLTDKHIIARPIPLTAEVFEKSGFLAYQGGWRDSRIGNISQGSDGYYLDDNESGSVNLKPLLYLHELQNLYFVIVGEDLIYTP